MSIFSLWQEKQFQGVKGLYQVLWNMLKDRVHLVEKLDTLDCEADTILSLILLKILNKNKEWGREVLIYVSM